MASTGAKRRKGPNCVVLGFFLGGGFVCFCFYRQKNGSLKCKLTDQLEESAKDPCWMKHQSKRKCVVCYDIPQSVPL